MSRTIAVFDLDSALRGAATVDRLPRFAPVEMEEHRRERRRLVLTTALPADRAEEIAEDLGFDAVIPAVRGRRKLLALRGWSQENGAVLRRSYAYAGSIRDAGLLAEVAHPTVVDPDPQLATLAWLRGWPTRSFAAPPGVLRVAGRELQDVFRPLTRPELVPYARFRFDGLENIPAEGAAIVCANHRSYFDASAVGLAISRSGRNARFLGKREVFDVPVVGTVARWMGGIRVERATGSDEPLLAAAEALRGGDLIALMPQGTIPRGPAFFEPELKGRWGAARLAAMTGAPVIPVGLWGTEKVWPRSSRLPRIDLRNPPIVTVTVGPAVELFHQDPDEDTKRIMAAITDLLPPEAHERRDPTPEELALTFPPGYRGDVTREVERRPGTD